MILTMAALILWIGVLPGVVVLTISILEPNPIRDLSGIYPYIQEPDDWKCLIAEDDVEEQEE